MKKIRTLLICVAAAALMAASVAVFAGCGGGYKVTYLLPDGATGTLPETASYEQYAEFTVPAMTDASMPHCVQIGWNDSEGNFYENGETVVMGNSDITLTAVFQGVELAVSYCENAGNFFMPGKGDLGPTPAFTHFYADKTWEAEATGKAMYSSLAGTWDLDSGGALKMTLVTQDGRTLNEAVEIDTSDERCFSWTFSHQSDRGGSLKYHRNHISRYELIKAYNDEFGTSITLPAEPEFTLTFDANGGDGEQAAISAKSGEEVTMPACTFTREGYVFGGWQIAASENVSANAGDKYTMVSWDLTVKAQWTAEE